MSRPTVSTVPGPLVVADTFGRVQIAPCDGSVTVDIQGRHYGTNAQLYVDLRHLLGAAIEAALDAPSHQPGLWSQATARFAARRSA
jgi:hypothetical protein